MEITRFNPHAMADCQIRLLSTGRDRLVETVARTLTEGEGSRQHVLVTAPRGFGKSFFARAIELAVQDLELPAFVTVLPEEQRNVSTPSSFLREILRGLKRAPAASVAGLFLDDPPGAWDAARAELDAYLATSDQLQIVVVENFDMLISSVFDDPTDQSRLRALLSESERLGVLATATTAEVDRDYDQRLFHAFAKFTLAPWSEEDHLLYFERRAILDGREIEELDRGKIRALAQFTGGAPRMAVALANLLLENDPLGAASLLDKLVDDLTPYYQALIEQMPPRTKTLFDALIRLSEPCSQSELAARVGTTQNRIAQHFAWLRERHIVTGRRRTGARDYLYQVADRLFVQYYRKRHLLHDSYTPLAGMAELLDGFFSAEENRRQAVALYEDGRGDEACEFIRAFLSAGGSDLGAWAARTDNHEAIQAIGLSETGDQAGAMQHFKRALAIARTADDELGVALILGQSGILASRIGNYGAAIEAHREALAIWQQRGQSTTIAWVLSQLAQDYRGALQFDDALRCSRRALDLWESEGAQDRVASLWGEVAENLRRLGRTDDAVHAYRNAETIWKALDDDAGQAWVLGGIGLAHRESGHHHDAIQSHRRAIMLLQTKPKRRFSVALNHSWLAVNFRQLRDYEAALEHDRTALDLWETLSQDRQAIKTMISISVTHMCRLDFEDAFAASREAFRKAVGANYQSHVIWSAGQLAYLHVHAGEVGEIWRYLDDHPVRDMRRLCETLMAQAGAALSVVEREHGRAEAFARGIELLEGLKARGGLAPLNESATYMLSGLLDTGQAYPLLRDLTAESVTLGALSPPRREAIDLATDYLQADRDETLIEQADPDIGDAVRAIIQTVEERRKRGPGVGQ